MEAKLKLGFEKLPEKDEKLICVILQHQCLKKTAVGSIRQLSKLGAEWLVDYETGLLENSKSGA